MNIFHEYVSNCTLKYILIGLNIFFMNIFLANMFIRKYKYFHYISYFKKYIHKKNIFIRKLSHSRSLNF